MEITLNIPDDLAAKLTPGQDLSRAVLEAFGLEAYRQRRISGYQLQLVLGLESRWDVDAFLKEHKVEKYTVEDLEEDWAIFKSSSGGVRPAPPPDRHS